MLFHITFWKKQACSGKGKPVGTSNRTEAAGDIGRNRLQKDVTEFSTVIGLSYIFIVVVVT